MATASPHVLTAGRALACRSGRTRSSRLESNKGRKRLAVKLKNDFKLIQAVLVKKIKINQSAKKKKTSSKLHLVFPQCRMNEPMCRRHWRKPKQSSPLWRQMKRPVSTEQHVRSTSLTPPPPPPPTVTHTHTHIV